MTLDPTTAALAATAILSLTTFAQKGAEEFAKTAGKAAFEQVQKLLGTLRRHFAHDPEAITTLQNFEQKPERYQGALESILQEKLAQDATLAQELRSIINALGPSITIIQELGTAGTVVGLTGKNIKSGTVDVYQSATEVDNLTGVELDGDLGS